MGCVYWGGARSVHSGVKSMSYCRLGLGIEEGVNVGILCVASSTETSGGEDGSFVGPPGAGLVMELSEAVARNVESSTVGVSLA